MNDPHGLCQDVSADVINRRAKLKRHTTDDQARMMRSRALPDDFDTTQALHSPFGVPQAGAPISSMGAYPAYAEHGDVRPLTIDTLRGGANYNHFAPQSYSSPTGMSPALGAFAFTPPHSVPDRVSPGNSNSMSPYSMQHQAAYESSRRAPICLPALDNGYAPMHLQRVPYQDQSNRVSGEPTSAPLRSSVSFSGEGSSMQHSHTFPERSSSLSGHAPWDQRSHSARTIGMAESETYGSGLPCEYP